MSHIGRIVAGTLAKRGRRGGSSVSSLISLTVVVVVVVWPSKSTGSLHERGSWPAQNSWRGFDEEKTEGSQTTNKKGEEKRERVTTM